MEKTRGREGTCIVTHPSAPNTWGLMMVKNTTKQNKNSKLDVCISAQHAVRGYPVALRLIETHPATLTAPSALNPKP